MYNAQRPHAVFAVLVAALALFTRPHTGVGQGVAPQDADRPEAAHSTYVPVLMSGYPWRSIVGVEAINSTNQGTQIYTRTVTLGASRVRMNVRISWRKLQPTEGGPIDWSSLATFEQELISLRSAGIIPTVVVDDYPTWASSDATNSCTAIRADKFAAFADFMVAFVTRYGVAPYHVKYWELGNEPDVDPIRVPKNSPFGCWGDIDDPFYGGRTYGEMLKVVTPRIRVVDPQAEIWVGGLLLDREVSLPGNGRPEFFLRGILEAGAGPYFDAVPYHFYPPYQGNSSIDHSLIGFNASGGVIGKANYLRSTMAEYGFDKPIHLNETALMCPHEYDNSPAYCKPPETGFYTASAHYAVKGAIRAMSAGVKSFIWYIVDNGGFRYSGLFDWSGQPRPAYSALRNFVNLTRNTTYLSLASGYPDTVEAFALRRSSNEQVHIVWAKTDDIFTIDVPTSKLIAAYDIDGNTLTSAYLSGGNTYWNIGISPVYIVRRP